MFDKVKKISRRRFLEILGAAAIVSTVAVALTEPRNSKFLARLRAFYYERTDPELKRTPTGPLSEHALEVLQATTQALVDTPVEINHYRDFFQWRSQNLRGYRDCYEEFAFTLNQAAGKTAQRPFSECDMTVRQKILEKVDLSNTGRLGRLVRGIFERKWLRFEKYIVREILALFVRTDGWVLLGYESWPGIPRGLDQYTKPPETPFRAA